MFRTNRTNGEQAHGVRFWAPPRTVTSVRALLAASAVFVVGLAAWPYTVDDAFVVGRYARRIVSGNGYTMVDGEPTDGVTGPLWLLPGMAAELVGIDAVAASKAFGLLCMALALALLVARAENRVQGRTRSRTAVVLAVPQSTLGIWAVAGLETGAAALAFSVALLAAQARPSPRPRTAGIGIACLAWLRPEMALCGAMVLVSLLIRRRQGAWRAVTIAATGALGSIAFRLAMFGSALPLAVHAKPGSLGNGFEYTAIAVLVATGGVGAWLAWLGSARGRSDDRAAGLAIAAHLVAVPLAGGDWMPGFRLFAPILPAYVVLAGSGLAALTRRRRGPLVCAVALALACALPAVNSVVQLPEVRSAGLARHRLGGPLADWLGEHAHTVALLDVGFLAYRSGVAVVDLGGITDPVVAHCPGGHTTKRIPIEYLRVRNPDAIVFHAQRPPRVSQRGALLALDGFPVERRLAASDWVRTHFRVVRTVGYSKRYYYVVMLRQP